MQQKITGQQSSPIKTKLKAYFMLGRFHSLAGAWLLLIPAMWSLALNYNYQIPLVKLIFYYSIFIIGAIFMRAFGCVINDMADIKFDSLIKRTKNRPLANKQLTKSQAVWFLVFLGFIPLILLFFLNHFAQIVALLALFFVVAYPFTKRFFQAPQLILGLTFNWGIILADATLNQQISFATWVLYGASIFWTLAYDSVYAYQDYEDDKKVGVKSLAVLIGKKPHNVILAFYIVMLGLIMVVGYLHSVSYVWYFLMLLVFLPIFYKSKTLDYFNGKACFLFFKHNVVLGLLIWLIFLLNHNI